MMRRIALASAALAALSFVAVGAAQAENPPANAAKPTTKHMMHHKMTHHKKMHHKKMHHKPMTEPAPKSS
jgi:Spy/CpxP family protein refolding chaperone